MNSQLTKMVESTSVTAFAPKKQVEFKHKSVEEKQRVIQKEVQNNEQILENVLDEYTKLKARLDVVKDPEYIMKIEDQIQDANKRTEQIKKTNVKLNLATAVSGKDLNEIDSEGAPPAIKEATFKAKELAILKRKMDKMIEDNEKFEEEKANKDQKLATLTEKYEKLLVIAEHMKIAGASKEVAEIQAALKKKVEDLEAGIKILENKNVKYIKNQLQQEIDDLTMLYNRDSEHYNTLDKMLEQQKETLKNMIEDENFKNRSDKTTKEIINKIKLTLEGNDIDITVADTSTTKNQKLTKPPLNKDAKKDIYEGLPLFSPSKLRDAKKNVVIRKTDLNMDRKTSPDSILKKDDRSDSITKNEKKPPLKQSRPNSHKETPNDKKLVVVKDEEKPKEDINPAFSKPNIFKKPFGKKGDDNSQSPEKKDDIPVTISTKPTENTTQESGKKLDPVLPDNKSKKDEQLSLPDFLKDNKKQPDIKKDDFKPLAKDSGVANSIKTEGPATNLSLATSSPTKLNNNAATTTTQNKLQSELPIDESINLGGAVSRVNRNRRQRADEKKDDPWASTDLKSNDFDLKASKDKPITDPFAKFDNTDTLNLGGKTVKKTQDFDGVGLFNPVEEPAKNTGIGGKGLGIPDKGPNFFGVDDGDDFKKVQVRKGPRDRSGAANQNKENIDDLFGGGKTSEVKLDNKPKDNIASQEVRPSRRTNFLDEKKNDDDLFGDDLFTKKENKLTLDPVAKKDDDLFGKKTQFSTINTQPEGKQEKAQEKFSLASDTKPISIGNKPMKMKAGGNENKEKDLALKAEKGGGGFFDGLDD